MSNAERAASEWNWWYDQYAAECAERGVTPHPGLAKAMYRKERSPAQAAKEQEGVTHAV